MEGSATLEATGADVAAGIGVAVVTTFIEATPVAIEAELERRETARTLSGSLRLFIEAAWPIVEPAYRYKHNYHIDAMCDALEAASRREILRLLLNIPPRHMKSLTTEVFWPAWWWTFEPEIRFLTASYGDQLAVRDARKQRMLIVHQWFRNLWGDVFSLLPDQNTKSRFENDKLGYRIATSVGGVGTGEGGDVIIIDDPHKTDEIESEVEREAVIDWHDGTISTRFNEPDRGVEVLIMQRLHQKDLAGHVLEQGGWEHICIPAEYDRKHPFMWPDDPRTEQGELLWPDRFGRTALDALKKRLGSYRAAGQLQQLPVAREGELLKRWYWQYFHPSFLDEVERLPRFTKILASWDTAFKDKTTSDYVVGTVWGVKGGDRYLLRRVREQLSFGATKRAMKEVRQWALDTFPGVGVTTLIEKSANGVDIITELKREITGVVSHTAQTDKMLRAQEAEPTLEAGNCHVPGFMAVDQSGPGPNTPAWVMEFIDELAQFNKGEYDDQVDSWSQAMNWLNLKASQAATLEEPDDDEKI